MILIDKTNVRVALKAGCSIVLLGLIFYRVEWSKTLHMFSRINVYFILLTIMLNAVGVVVSALKWKYLLDVQGIEVPFHRLHGLYYVGLFFNNFLPSTIGGDVVRARMTCGQGKKQAEAFSAVVAERVTGFGGMLLIVGAAAFINVYTSGPPKISVLAVLAMMGITFIGVLGILLTFVSYRVRLGHSVSRWLRPVLKVRDVLGSYVNYPNVLLKSVLLSGLFHFLLVSNGYCFARSIGLQLPFVPLAVIFPLAMLLAMIPISLNGLGITEGSLIVLLSLIGVSTEAALIMGVLSRLFPVMASVVGGILFAGEGLIDSQIKASEGVATRDSR